MKNRWVYLFYVGILLLGVALGSITWAKTFATIENLDKAHLVEADAYNKYSKFAEQADKEGYPMVAKLFRSVAFSELMHMRNHAVALESLGGKPQKFKLTPVKAGSTKENLEVSSKDERKDEVMMYEAFMVQAEKDGLRDAKTSFKYAVDSARQHKQLFEKALNPLGPKNVDYYVDVRSGDTVEVQRETLRHSQN
jgi:rubrerythrin